MSPNNSIDPSGLVDRWHGVLYDFYKADIEHASASGDDSLYISFDLLSDYGQDPDLAEYTLMHPVLSLDAAEKALSEIEPACDHRPTHVRIVALPETSHRSISELRTVDIGRLISIQGIVKRRTTVYPKVNVASFQCLKCGIVITVEQDGATLTEPLECPERQGGCGRRTRFRWRADLSDMHDMQKLEIQENPEDVEGDRQVESITVLAEDDLAGVTNAGKRVTIVGVMQGEQRHRGAVKLTEFTKVIHAVSIEQHDDTSLEDAEISPEDEMAILEASRDPDIYHRLVQSIAPTIYGMDNIKEAIMYQMFGGAPKTMPDGTRIRGDIHILICGDPATAKSQLLKFVSRAMPRSIQANGKDASAAGLTASAVKDTKGWSEGGWVLEAGAMVLADRGHLCVDELDKMGPSDRSAMHQAMEQQEISINKAGINTTLKTRCSVLAAANPKLGRFDHYTSIPEQIALPPALVSRFDLIFVVRDIPERERDSRICSHILRVHRTGEEMGMNTQGHIDDMEILTPSFDISFLRKYIAYAKQHVTPRLTPDAMTVIQDYFVELRSLYQNRNDSIAITPRDVEAVIRLAEASARIRISETVDKEDAERARTIMANALGESACDENGFLDIDTIETGMSHKQQERVKWLTNFIRHNRGATRDDIMEASTQNGYRATQIASDLDHLIRDGKIYCPREGTYQMAY